MTRTNRPTRHQSDLGCWHCQKASQYAIICYPRMFTHIRRNSHVACIITVKLKVENERNILWSDSAKAWHVQVIPFSPSILDFFPCASCPSGHSEWSHPHDHGSLRGLGHRLPHRCRIVLAPRLPTPMRSFQTHCPGYLLMLTWLSTANFFLIDHDNKKFSRNAGVNERQKFNRKSNSRQM